MMEEEKKGEMGRGRKTRKEVRRKGMHCDWTLPTRGWGTVFFFQKPVAPGDPKPGQSCSKVPTTASQWQKLY